MTRLRLIVAAGALALPCAAIAQQAAPAAAPAGPTLSGILVGNYQYLTGGPRKDQNQFALERAYVNLRGTVAPRTTFRITTDVFQSGDNNGWTVRLKYGYLNYELGAGQPWATQLRAGMLQTVAIEHIETFWPRWLGPVAIDRHGFFSSADVGAAAHVALPSRLGEVYAHVVNGPGFGRRETDRFKDYAARLSLTPLAARDAGLLSTLTLTGWVYAGATASRFAADTARPIGSGLQRDRLGVFAGIRDPRLVLGVEHARRADEGETGANTPTSPRRVSEVEGSVTSLFTVARPLAWGRRDGRSPFALVARYDRVQPDTDAGTDFHYVFAGALYEVNSRLSLALDYQEQLGGAIGPAGRFQGWFLNFALTY